MKTNPATSGFEAFRQQVRSLWERQAREWSRLANGLKALREASRRSFDLDGTHVIAQCNPARVQSASARVDAASLARRPCFLCPEHLPAEQEGITYQTDWLILCNPAPLIEPHFTIATLAHLPQRIPPASRVLLDLAHDLGDQYTVFYNGPASGASAPDHLHLQAAPAGKLPFEIDLAEQLRPTANEPRPRWLEWIVQDNASIGITHPGRRPVVLMTGTSRSAVLASLETVLHVLGDVRPADPEPMFNLFAHYDEQGWTLWMFPRSQHRPQCYGQKPDQFLISPGAIDLGGIIISPRPHDFERLDEQMIHTIYEEVLLSPSDFAHLRQALIDAFG